MHTSLHRQAGMSLVEVLVALAIGMFLLLGMVTVFSNSSQTQREMERAGSMIENGRYAISVLTDDLRHAGFYGHFYDLSTLTAPSTTPDPCEKDDTDDMLNALAYPIHGFAAANLTTRADISGTGCTALLTNANLRVGSDVLVLRRVSTALAHDDSTASSGGKAIANMAYLQGFYDTAEVQFGNSSADVQANATNTNTSTHKTAANGAVSIRKRDGSYPDSDDSDGTGPAADIRRLLTHTYFVAPCSIGTATNGLCQANDDGIPTLKRLELGVNSGGARAIVITPLVEGVEYMKVEYGIDDSPSSTSSSTGLSGDGVPDRYEASPSDTEFQSVVSARIYLLVRNAEASAGHTDGKSYTLGGTAVAAAGDSYKRRVFSSEIRLANPAQRRTIP